MSFDPKEFRRCLGNFATGVTVITAKSADGTQVGVTANSFNSVSLDPPLILWSIVKTSSSYAVFENADHFSVNILAADQIDLSNNFAKPSEDKFANIETRNGVGGAPLLTNTAANFQCEKYQVIDGGDHWIMIGKVVAFENFGRAPLLYVQGSYAGAIPFTGAKTPAQNVASDKTLARLHDSAIYLMHKVLQKVQENYLPKQSSTGLSTSEARLLLVLSDTAGITIDDLTNLVTIPSVDVIDGVESLKGFGLINSDLELTDKGEEMAERLWAISNQQQSDIFANLKEDELNSFKQQLHQLLKQLS
ncbi:MULTISPECIES: p-hydroxyphenylacetate 3-hydroxylase reductase component [Marinomonas]|uniref:Flavin reductase (DIM6/NTAB) family NADH-FMN oxidoreductase RutF n=1 Tax=Marinomonas alcarazii TaxID=491949 RepID=A0A318V531_9GAMM|nr:MULTISPECIES: flavin reductase [Marinomonas]PYF83153.1 flavin reductase (DIM6/NTAB) family NADH-FMN oxidoreductase RutF [Marinomonas alcarazii]